MVTNKMKNQHKVNLNSKYKLVWYLSFCLLMITYEFGFTSKNIILADDEWGEFDYKTEIEELNLRYKNPIVFDTIIQFNEDKIKIEYNYYCLIDSQYKIPKNYYFDESIQELNAYQFVVDLKMSLNGKYLFNQIISNDEIIKKTDLSKDLIEYGTIYTFDFTGFNNKDRVFEFDISFSIPITDIGVGIKLLIDMEGNYRIE